MSIGVSYENVSKLKSERLEIVFVKHHASNHNLASKGSITRAK